jgi:hypothetical protein
MSIQKTTKIVRPFIGWTIFQVFAAEILIEDILSRHEETAEIRALSHEIPEGEGEDHEAKRTFEKWREDIKNYYGI